MVLHKIHSRDQGFGEIEKVQDTREKMFSRGILHLSGEYFLHLHKKHESDWFSSKAFLPFHNYFVSQMAAEESLIKMIMSQIMAGKKMSPCCKKN